MAKDKNDFPEGHPFYGVSAVDGFHVVSQRFNRKQFLSVVAYSRGHAVPVSGDNTQLQLLTIDCTDPQQAGAFERLALALQGVTQYFTTGGSWEELLDMLAKMRLAIPGGMVFPGFHLCTSYMTDEMALQHIYADDKESGDAVVWQAPILGDAGFPVGGFIGPTTLAAIKDQQDDEQRE